MPLALLASACAPWIGGVSGVSDSTVAVTEPTTVATCPAPPDEPGSSAREVGAALLRDKLGADLMQLVLRHRDEGLKNALEWGVAKGIDLDGHQVSVRVVAAEATDVEPLRDWLDRAGGAVGAVFENNLYGTVPIACVATLAEGQAVWRMDLERQIVSPFGAAGEPMAVPEARGESMPQQEKLSEEER